MNKTLAFLLGLMGLNATSACSQQLYENADVRTFAELIDNPEVQLLDVRTAEEYSEGHIERAFNVDVKQSTFMEMAKKRLDTGKRVAVYCRSGRRSADAANQLVAEGYQVTNLLGGILAWEKEKMPVTTSNYEVDIFKTKSGKTVKFHALMHASIRLVYDGKEIEIDPVRKLGNRAIDYTAMPKADYIFVTSTPKDATMATS